MKRKKEKGERTTDEGSEEEKFPSGGWKSKEATEGNMYVRTVSACVVLMVIFETNLH